jgi:hypothetical protein
MKELAKRIVLNTPKSDLAGFDPMIFISLILDVLKILKENCNVDVEKANNPGVFQRMWLRHYIRKAKVPSDQFYTVYNALLNYGAKAGAGDLQDFYGS